MFKSKMVSFFLLGDHIFIFLWRKADKTGKIISLQEITSQLYENAIHHNTRMT